LEEAMSEIEIVFNFDRDKAIEAILYIAHKIEDPTFHSVNKLLYFADKTSLERYGRFISGDFYVALEHGPVPSNTYDLMKYAPETGDLGFLVEDGHHVKPIRQADTEQFSESDIEALDLAIEVYGMMPFWQKTEESHDDAWGKAWEARGNAKSKPMAIEDIAQLLKDGDKLIEHLRTQYD
jgi:uncharacterized phage-associated protein